MRTSAVSFSPLALAAETKFRHPDLVDSDMTQVQENAGQAHEVHSGLKWVAGDSPHASLSN